MLIVANRSGLRENINGVGVLPKIAVVLRHRPQNFTAFFIVFQQSRLQQLVTNDVCLRPFPDPSPLVVRSLADVSSEFVFRQFVEHFLSKFCFLSDAWSSSLGKQKTGFDTEFATRRLHLALPAQPIRLGRRQLFVELLQ